MTEEDDSGGPGLPEEVRRAVEDPGRLATVARLDRSNMEPDADFDRLARIAAALVGTPVALVTLVERNRQWFRARHGVEDRQTPVSMSFCAHALAEPSGRTMIVENLAADPRFADNPLVSGERHVRYYAGAPITVHGVRVGTVCALDHVPRPPPTPETVAALEDLAATAGALFSLKEDRRRAALAEAALARVEMRHALALDAGAIASWVWDVRRGSLECDVLMPILFGLEPATHIRARDIFARFDPRDSRHMRMSFAEIMHAGEDYVSEFRVQGMQPTRWLSTRGRVAERDARGRPAVIVGVTFDISEHKSAQERQRNLLRELNHRVKNTLATVQAMATQTVRHAASPADFLPAFTGRLQALGAAHGLLSDLEWRGISLVDLVRKQIRPFVEPNDNRMSIAGDDVHLSPDQALALGLVLHELASNASKHGALSVPDGGVDLTWSVAEGEQRRLTIVWREHGGPTVSPPSRRGFGSILIQRSLGKILSSAVSHEYRPEGVYSEISLDLETDGTQQA